MQISMLLFYHKTYFFYRLFSNAKLQLNIVDYKNYFPIYIGNDKYRYYISIHNDSVFIIDRNTEQFLFACCPNNKSSTQVKSNLFLPTAEMSTSSAFWDTSIQDTVYVIEVKENGPHISDTPFLNQINFSKKYGFVKFFYRTVFLNNGILESYNRKLYPIHTSVKYQPISQCIR
jgi:hypothetical protein